MEPLTKIIKNKCDKSNCPCNYGYDYNCDSDCESDSDSNCNCKCESKCKWVDKILPWLNFSSNDICRETVKDLNIKKYMGTWYQIAAYPFIFNAFCDGAIAKYCYNECDCTVSVENQSLYNGNVIDTSRGIAWVPDSCDKGKLKIKFDGLFSFGEGDYWVLYYDGKNSIVGGPSGRNLWWLCRKPTVTCKEAKRMMNIICNFGYNTDKLIANPNVIC